MAWLLVPLSVVYAVLTAANRQAYRAGWRRAERAPVPVIVVGNLVVGGAGKTPTVIALVAALRAAGRKPGVVSRGYGRRSAEVVAVKRDSRAQDVGDEPLLIARRTGAPVAVGQRRLQAARELCRLHPEVDVIVSDDGLQHRALARDLELLVFDSRGVGNGCLLPAGPLREPMPAAPDGRLVLYNAARPSTPLPGATAVRSLAGALPLAEWQAGARPRLDALRTLRGRPLLAAAGLAAPERFFGMLEAVGLTIERMPLPDHAELDPLPWFPGQAREIVLTEKDAIKLPPDPPGPPIWVVTLDFSLPAGFVQAILDALPRTHEPRCP